MLDVSTYTEQPCFLNKSIEKFKKLENRKLPHDMDYSQLDGLRLEAREKLNAFRPDSVGQASRISGISPADINVLLIHLERMRHKGMEK